MKDSSTETTSFNKEEIKKEIKDINNKIAGIATIMHFSISVYPIAFDGLSLIDTRQSQRRALHVQGMFVLYKSLSHS